MSELQNARELINKVDKEMVRLFEIRMDAAKTVAEYKKENGLPVDDVEREKEIIEFADIGEHLYQICWCSKGDMKKIGEYIYQDKKDCFLHAKFENYKKLIDDNTEVNS